MSESLYRKIGRKYVPVAEYSNERCDSLGHGHWLVHSQPGSMSYSKITPDHIPVLAALQTCKEELIKELSNKMMTPIDPELTETQMQEYKDWMANRPSHIGTMYYHSMNDVVTKSLAEIEKKFFGDLVYNETMRANYEQLLCVMNLLK